MGFGKLFEAIVKTTVELPIAVAKDVVLGGVFEDEPHTVKKLRDISEDIDEIGD